MMMIREGGSHSRQPGTAGFLDPSSLAPAREIQHHRSCNRVCTALRNAGPVLCFVLSSPSLQTEKRAWCKARGASAAAAGGFTPGTSASLQVSPAWPESLFLSGERKKRQARQRALAMQCAIQLMRSPECVHRHVYTCGDAPELSSSCQSAAGCFPAGSPSAACCSRGDGVASLGLYTQSSSESRRTGGTLCVSRVSPAPPSFLARGLVGRGHAEWGCRDTTTKAAGCRDGSAEPGVTPGGVPGGLGLPAPHPPRSLRSAAPWGASGAPSAAAHVAVCFLDGPRESPRGPAMGHAARRPPPPLVSPLAACSVICCPSPSPREIPTPPLWQGSAAHHGGGSPVWAALFLVFSSALLILFLSFFLIFLSFFSCYFFVSSLWCLDPASRRAGGRMQAWHCGVCAGGFVPERGTAAQRRWWWWNALFCCWAWLWRRSVSRRSIRDEAQAEGLGGTRARVRCLPA